MKKRLFVMVIAVLAIVSLFVTCLVACDNSNDNTDPTPTPDDNKVTVSWYRGTDLLKEQKIEKGSKVESWTPETDANGNEFQGWFSEGSLTDAFDFDVEITEDTQIFSKWFNPNTYVEDENQYYVIGAGSGDIKTSSWNHALKENDDEELEVISGFESMMFEKQKVANKNVYTITLKMYAGDKFQICYTGNWDGQRGIGAMVGAEYADGKNAYDNNDYTAADKKYAVVKDADGNVIFEGSDEYNKTYDVWNIWLAEGQDGIYKFTWTTYPNNTSFNTLEYELVQKLDAQAETHNMYISGTMNEWAGKDVLDAHKMSKQEDGTWSAIYTITEADYAEWTEQQGPFGEQCAAFKVKNAISGSDYGVNGGATNFFFKAGTYAIKYNPTDNSVAVEELKYYLVGTFMDGEEQVNFAVKVGVTPELTVEGNIATGTVVATDVTSSYTWIATQGKPGVFAVKVVYGSSLAIKDWYSDAANNGDNFYLNAGTYTVSFDITTGVVTFTAA